MSCLPGYDRFQALDKLRKLDRVPQALRAFISWVGRPPAVFGLRQELSAYAKPLHGAGALLREQLRALVSAPGVASEGLDAAGRQRLPDACRWPIFYFPATPTCSPRRCSLKPLKICLATCWSKSTVCPWRTRLKCAAPCSTMSLGELAAGIPHGWKIKDGKGKYILAARSWRPVACRRY